MYNKILFPTDFSAASCRAMKHAQELARAFNAELHILNVIDDPLTNAATTSQSFRDELADVAQKKFVATCGTDPDLQNAKFVTRQGPAFVEIIRYARENAIDVIVMATHGRSALVHALLGSVAENVLRFAPCPVVSVPDPNLEFELP